MAMLFKTLTGKVDTVRGHTESRAGCPLSKALVHYISIRIKNETNLILALKYRGQVIFITSYMVNKSKQL